MSKPYKIAVNMEWTSKCNALCTMCPRQDIIKPQLMKKSVFTQALEGINNEDAFRCVIAGYGEPTTHPRFDEYIDEIRDHPVNFDMVTNGQLLNKNRLEKMDGALGMLIVSFSSISRAVYESVHVNLDHEIVKQNILLAKKVFKKTRLAISLTPMPECLDTLPETINWFRDNGITALTMSPTLYNRAGEDENLFDQSNRLRQLIKKYHLHSQELDFVDGLGNFLKQRRSNQFKCAARNSDLFISSSGQYLYCFNDISHSQPIGSVLSMSLRQAIEKREKMEPISDLCASCNLSNRYKFKELAGVASRYYQERAANLKLDLGFST